MTTPVLQPQLVMQRPLTPDLPAVQLANGYAIRCWQSSADDAAWDRIIGESFVRDAAGMFAQSMRPDYAFAAERVLFVCQGAEPVATASAWYRNEGGGQIGYLHYVGVRPAHAGKGLGLAVSLACLHRMIAEGRTHVKLQTDDFRLAAVRQYLRLDFVPLLVDENQRQRWRAVFGALGRPGLCERFAEVLNGAVASPGT